MDLGFMQSWRHSAAGFHAAGQAKAAALLLDCLRAGDPIVVMTGAAGLGKSRVLDAALSRLGTSGPRVLRLAAPFPTAAGLQGQMAGMLELADPETATPAELASAIVGLPEPAPGVASLAVVVDDAEAVPSALLQYLWLMHSVACRARPVMQLILVGRDVLWRRLGDPRLSGLRRAVSARLTMQPFSGAEAEAFLRQLLRDHGRRAGPEAMGELQRLGNGVPGRMVTLLDAACAGLPSRSTVTVQRVRAVLGVAPGPTARSAPIARLPRLVAGLPGLLSWHGAVAATIALGLMVGVSQLLGLGVPPPPPSRFAPDRAAAAPLPTPPVLPGSTPQGAAESTTRVPTPAGSPATGAVGTPAAGVPPEAPDPAAPQARIESADVQAADGTARADINLASLAPPSPAAAASPPAVRPASAGIHVQAEYPALDQVAEARARWAVGVLRGAGFDVSDPVAISRRALRPGVGYFSRGDHEAAKAVAHALAAAGRPVYVRQLSKRSDARPPGTIELLFATP